MEYAFSIILMITGTFFGLYVSRWDSWREIAGRGDLTGEWLSVSHSGDQEVVTDKITIAKARGKLRFTNAGNDYGYRYECHCSLALTNILFGQWHSTRPGSAAKGRVLMVVNTQGTTISGFYSGQNANGTDLLLGWVMARTQPELDFALSRLPVVVGLPKQPGDKPAPATKTLADDGIS
jgi:hypothetical protein